MKTSKHALPYPSQYAGWLLEAKEEFERKHSPDEHWEKWYGLYLAYRADGIGQTTAAGWANLDSLSAPGVK